MSTTPASTSTPKKRVKKKVHRNTALTILVILVAVGAMYFGYDWYFGPHSANMNLHAEVKSEFQDQRYKIADDNNLTIEQKILNTKKAQNQLEWRQGLIDNRFAGFCEDRIEPPPAPRAFKLWVSKDCGAKHARDIFVDDLTYFEVTVYNEALSPQTEAPEFTKARGAQDTFTVIEHVAGRIWKLRGDITMKTRRQFEQTVELRPVPKDVADNN